MTMLNEFVLIGAGGHASVVLATARSVDLTVVGYVSPSRTGAFWAKSLPWLGDDTEFCKLAISKYTLLNGIGSKKWTCDAQFITNS